MDGIAEAVPLARQAVRIKEQNHGINHPLTASSLSTLSDILHLLNGNDDELKDSLESQYGDRIVGKGQRERDSYGIDNLSVDQTLLGLYSSIGFVIKLRLTDTVKSAFLRILTQRQSTITKNNTLNYSVLAKSTRYRGNKRIWRH